MNIVVNEQNRVKDILFRDFSRIKLAVIFK